MENSKFFQNEKCEYFPCHKIKDVQDFNCMFCFCPLYYTENCGGNYTYKDDIKCCGDCTFPHEKENYDLIIQKINEYIKKRGGNT